MNAPTAPGRRNLGPPVGRPLLALLFALAACADVPAPQEQCEHPPVLLEQSGALSSIDCTESQDTGYKSGNPFPITVVTVDGKKVEKATANAYYVMAQAAAAAGVTLKVSSGFRTMAEQQYFYNCYVNCNCNNCNLAAKPGYSNHQSGHALDLNTSSPGVLAWLNAHGGSFGFSRTVPSEDWHWEWWGGGPGGGPCGACVPHCEGTKIVGADCGTGDCAAYGATCVSDGLGTRCVFGGCPAVGSATICVDATKIGTCNNGAVDIGDCAAYGAGCVHDALGARCVFYACPAVGTTKVCLDDAKIATCTDGAADVGDCGAYGAFCSTAGAQQARCVLALCTGSPSTAPWDHHICLPDGSRFHCTADGGGAASPCPAGTHCAPGPDATCQAPCTPAAEVCNGADDDCDGEVDEGFGVGTPCTAGEGACAAAGVVVCDGGGARCDAAPPCDDGDPCTDDCDPAVGCVHAPVTGCCSATVACAPGEACDGGVCVLALCAPCARDADCHGGGLCLKLRSGAFCGIPCDQGACPAGTGCVQVDGSPQCVPDSTDCACGVGLGTACVTGSVARVNGCSQPIAVVETCPRGCAQGACCPEGTAASGDACVAPGGAGGGGGGGGAGGGGGGGGGGEWGDPEHPGGAVAGSPAEDDAVTGGFGAAGAAPSAAAQGPATGGCTQGGAPIAPWMLLLALGLAWRRAGQRSGRAGG